MPPPDELELQGLFKPDLDVRRLTALVQQAGVGPDDIHVMSPLPLVNRASDRVLGIPLYVVTIAAGFVGIAVGLFFAAGTAMMYPLMTGGKPIVAPPVVGIISYETMMLLGIVITFLATLIRIKGTNAKIHSRDERIDDGRIAVSVRVPILGPIAAAVQHAMEQAGALDVRLSVIATGNEAKVRASQQAAALFMPLVLIGALTGCSRDMQDQPSYQAQEAPRRHSPIGSVPRQSRRVLVPPSPAHAQTGEQAVQLFQVNCAHCHGTHGEGDGPVAPFLKEQPVNLAGDEVRAMAEAKIYAVLTDGKDMMPSFQGELSSEERWQLARYVLSLSRSKVARGGKAEEQADAH